MNRRGVLGLAGAAAALGGCERVAQNPSVNGLLRSAEGLTQGAQRLVTARTALSPEFEAADISPQHRANGTVNPTDGTYRAHVESGFADYRLEVRGLVEQPLSLSLADLRGMPWREQITRHDCVEGWSNIGRWAGARLSAVLDRAGLRSEAKYVVFRCFDNLSPGQGELGRYYESVDLIDAYHPQTILALDMNGAPLGVPYGAPVRVRLERQLGYKMAKYISAIEAVADYRDIGMGRGGFWEDRGYQWYAGI